MYVCTLLCTKHYIYHPYYFTNRDWLVIIAIIYASLYLYIGFTAYRNHNNDTS